MVRLLASVARRGTLALHGSPELHDTLRPAPSGDLVKKFGNDMSVFATSLPSVALIHGLIERRTPSRGKVGFQWRYFVDTVGRAEIRASSDEIFDRLRQTGYVYVVDGEPFVWDATGFECKSPVEVKPLVIVPVLREDLLAQVSISVGSL